MQEKAHFLRTTNIVFYEIQGGMNHFKEVCFKSIHWKSIIKSISWQKPYTLNLRSRGDNMYVDTIRAKDIDRYFGKGECVLVDLRGRDEYTKSHIPSAINIPYEDIDDYMNQFNHYNQVILYCDRGNLSLLAAKELSKKCKGQMISIGGGFNAYKQYNRGFTIK